MQAAVLNDLRVKKMKHQGTYSQGIYSLLESFDLGLENTKQRLFSSLGGL